jgi:hypothetical protein
MSQGKKLPIEKLRAIVALKKDYSNQDLATLLHLGWTTIDAAEKNLKNSIEKEAKKALLLKRAKEMGLI